MSQGHPSVNQTLYHWIHHGRYPVLFSVLLCCGLGLPLPEDIPIIAAGVMVARGELNLAMASIAAWCGIMGGDCILYWLGRKFGADVTRIPMIGRHINTNRIARVERWFDRWGVWVVAIGRLFAGIRGAMVVVAGATRFRFTRFVVADGLAAIVSGGLFLWIGYKFGQNLHRMHAIVSEIKGGMLIALGLLAISGGAYFLYRRQLDRQAERRGFPIKPPEAKPE